METMTCQVSVMPEEGEGFETSLSIVLGGEFLRFGLGGKPWYDLDMVVPNNQPDELHRGQVRVRTLKNALRGEGKYETWVLELFVHPQGCVLSIEHPLPGREEGGAMFLPQEMVEWLIQNLPDELPQNRVPRLLGQAVYLDEPQSAAQTWIGGGADRPFM